MTHFAQQPSQNRTPRDGTGRNRSPDVRCHRPLALRCHWSRCGIGTASGGTGGQAARGTRGARGTQAGRSRQAFSLLETMLGVSILGIGLIMLAAVFPVALTEHRLSIERAEALDMLSKSQALLHERLDPDLLWFDETLIGGGMDSPWYLVPFANLDVSLTWAPDAMDYSDAVNGAPTGLSMAQFGPLGPLGADILSDRILPFPFTDAASHLTPHRAITYGFYRRLANGSTEYAAAACKQRRNQVFVRQDLSVPSPFDSPTGDASRLQRFPTPWRVNVARFPQSQILYNNSGGATLPQLAPPGSKIMIRGANSAALPFGASGRLLTVADPIDLGGAAGVQVFEDISDVFPDDPSNPADGDFRFDVWLFPPAAQGSGFGNESPLVEWKVGL